MNALSVVIGTELRCLHYRINADYVTADLWLNERLTAERWELCQRICESK